MAQNIQLTEVITNSGKKRNCCKPSMSPFIYIVYNIPSHSSFWYKNSAMFGQELMHITFNPFPSKALFLRVNITSLMKTMSGKGETARNQQFLLFP